MSTNIKDLENNLLKMCENICKNIDCSKVRGITWFDLYGKTFKQDNNLEDLSLEILIRTGGKFKYKDFVAVLIFKKELLANLTPKDILEEIIKSIKRLPKIIKKELCYYADKLDYYADILEKEGEEDYSDWGDPLTSCLEEINEKYDSIHYEDGRRGVYNNNKCDFLLFPDTYSFSQTHCWDDTEKKYIIPFVMETYHVQQLKFDLRVTKKEVYDTPVVQSKMLRYTGRELRNYNFNKDEQNKIKYFVDCVTKELKEGEKEIINNCEVKNDN